METGSVADKMREKTARKKEPGCCSGRDDKLVFWSARREKRTALARGLREEADGAFPV